MNSVLKCLRTRELFGRDAQTVRELRLGLRLVSVDCVASQEDARRCVIVGVSRDAAHVVSYSSSSSASSSAAAAAAAAAATTSGVDGDFFGEDPESGICVRVQVWSLCAGPNAPMRKIAELPVGSDEAPLALGSDEQPLVETLETGDLLVVHVCCELHDDQQRSHAVSVFPNPTCGDARCGWHTAFTSPLLGVVSGVPLVQCADRDTVVVNGISTVKALRFCVRGGACKVRRSVLFDVECFVPCAVQQFLSKGFRQQLKSISDFDTDVLVRGDTILCVVFILAELVKSEEAPAKERKGLSREQVFAADELSSIFEDEDDEEKPASPRTESLSLFLRSMVLLDLEHRACKVFELASWNVPDGSGIENLAASTRVAMRNAASWPTSPNSHASRCTNVSVLQGRGSLPFLRHPSFPFALEGWTHGT